MTLEVIGAGFGRTGTMSLKVALEELGFGPCYHMTEVWTCPGSVDTIPSRSVLFSQPNLLELSRA
jgi:hypothetical protein